MTAALDARCVDCSSNCGVYLLIRMSRVVYVGSSLNVHGRIAWHRGSKRFDRAVWLPVAATDRRSYEGALIRFFRPPHNEASPSPGDHADDNDILEHLGLPPHDDAEAVWRADRERFSRRRREVLRATRRRDARRAAGGQ